MPLSKPDFGISAPELDPFKASQLPEDELERLRTDWMVIWDLSVRTNKNSEEVWALNELTTTFNKMMGDPPMDEEHGLPRGMWGAMQWTAHNRTVIRSDAS